MSDDKSYTDGEETLAGDLGQTADGFGGQPSGFDHTAQTAGGMARPTSDPQAKTNIVTPDIELPHIPGVTIGAELGRGGMGVVFRGRQEFLDRAVAIKVLHTSGVAKPEVYQQRFEREAKVLAGLDHPHIVSCHQAGVAENGDCFLVMEFVSGSELRTRIEREGGLSERETLLIGRAMAQALGHALESGIIHRDVKVENVLLAEREQSAADEMPYIAKLADFGLALPDAVPGDSRLTHQGMLMGTPSCMAPEQFDDPLGVDFRADAYALGCTMFHCLAGNAAFSANSLTELVKAKTSSSIPDVRQAASVSNGTADLIARLMHPNRDHRPASYDDIVDAIDALLGKVGTGTQGTAAAASRPGLALFGGLGLVVLLGLLVWRPWALAEPTAATLTEPGRSPDATPPATEPDRPVGADGQAADTASDTSGGTGDGGRLDSLDNGSAADGAVDTDPVDSGTTVRQSDASDATDPDTSELDTTDQGQPIDNQPPEVIARVAVTEPTRLFAEGFNPLQGWRVSPGAWGASESATNSIDGVAGDAERVVGRSLPFALPYAITARVVPVPGRDGRPFERVAVRLLSDGTLGPHIVFRYQQPYVMAQMHASAAINPDAPIWRSPDAREGIAISLQVSWPEGAPEGAVTLFVNGEYIDFVPLAVPPTDLELAVVAGTVQISDLSIAPIQ